LIRRCVLGDNYPQSSGNRAAKPRFGMNHEWTIREISLKREIRRGTRRCHGRPMRSGIRTLCAIVASLPLSKAA
jgi:hypothetical protein